MIYYSTLFLLATVSLTDALSDCVRSWQQPIMSRALIDQPSVPLSCHPDGRRCPGDRNSQCQFSFRLFRYVCCEDKIGEKPPECPRFHDTLLMVCDGGEGSCPKGYKCMASRLSMSTKICCRPNSSLKYPEPETTFRDRHIVPEFMPEAPSKQLQISFLNRTLLMGELFAADELYALEQPPTISIGDLKMDKQYTLMLIDISSPPGSNVLWMVVNVPVENGDLVIDRKARLVEEYHAPSEKDQPEGMHILILAVWEQLDNWPAKAISNFDPIQMDLTTWTNEYSEVIRRRPVAGNFYAYSTKVGKL